LILFCFYETVILNPITIRPYLAYNANHLGEENLPCFVRVWGRGTHEEVGGVQKLSAVDN